MILKEIFRCEINLLIIGKTIAIEFLSCLSLDYSYYENRGISSQSIVRWNNCNRLYKETASLKRQCKTEKGQNHPMRGKWYDSGRDFYGVEMQPFNYRKGHQSNTGWALD